MADITNDLNKINSIKEGIKSSLIAKNVDMAGVTFEQYPAKVASISGSGASGSNEYISTTSEQYLIDNEMGDYINYFNYPNINNDVQMTKAGKIKRLFIKDTAYTEFSSNYYKDDGFLRVLRNVTDLRPDYIKNNANLYSIDCDLTGGEVTQEAPTRLIVCFENCMNLRYVRKIITDNYALRLGAVNLIDVNFEKLKTLQQLYLVQCVFLSKQTIDNICNYFPNSNTQGSTVWLSALKSPADTTEGNNAYKVTYEQIAILNAKNVTVVFV